MKFSEWVKIKEMVVPNTVSKAPAQPPEPGAAAKKLKTKATILKTRASTLGKPPQAQIAALKGAARKLAASPEGIDDESMEDLDNAINGIQAKAGIKA